MARSRYDGIIIHDMRGSIANLTAWQMPTWQTGDLPYFPSWHTAFGPGGYRTGQQLARAKKHFPDPGRTMWYRWNSCECMAYAVADYLWIENLIDRRLVSYIQEFAGPVPGSAMRNVEAIPPKSTGSHASKLIDVLKTGHEGVQLSREEWVRLVTWIDANSPFYGSYFGRRNIKHIEHSDFRPVPDLTAARGTLMP